MKGIKKFDVFKMKIITDYKKENEKKYDFSLIGVNILDSSRGNVEKSTA